MKTNVDQNVTEPDKIEDPAALDRAIANNLVLNPSTTDQELANLLGVSRATINRRKNCKAVQSLIKETLDIPRVEIQRLTLKALQKMADLLEDVDPKIQISAASQLLRLAEGQVRAVTRASSSGMFGSKSVFGNEDPF
jgi:hypothetical protein